MSLLKEDKRGKRQKPMKTLSDCARITSAILEHAFMKNTFVILLSCLLLCGCSKQQPLLTCPRANLEFAGYDSPESAFKTWIWAIVNLDRTNMLQSLTPHAQEAWVQMLGEKTDSDLQATAAKNANKEEGFIIYKKKVVSSEDVVLFESMIGNDHVERMEIKKIGNEWKVDGPKD